MTRYLLTMMGSALALAACAPTGGHGVNQSAASIIENGFECPEEEAPCEEDDRGDPEPEDRMEPDPVEEANGDEGDGRDGRDDRGDPPPPPPDDQPPQDGEQCFVIQQNCVAGLRCEPLAPGDGFGRCVAAGEDGLGDDCVGPDDGEDDTCGEELSCLPDHNICSPFCAYNSFDCPFSMRCPENDEGNRFGVCQPADDDVREFPNLGADGACRPGADDCGDGEGCYPQSSRNQWDGFECAAAGDEVEGDACDPGSCEPGLVCTLHTGWHDDGRHPARSVFQFEWSGPERHPWSGRGNGPNCRRLCGPGVGV